MVFVFKTVGDDGDVFKELVKGRTVISVGGGAASQGGADGAVGLGIAAREGYRHVVIHELYLTRMVVGAVGREEYFEAFDGFECELDIELAGVGEVGRRGLSVIGDEPSAVKCFFDKSFALKSERKTKARSHRPEAACLAKHIAYVGAVEGEREGACVAETYRRAAWRHDESSAIFGHMAHEALAVVELFGHREAEIFVAAGEDDDIVWVSDFVGNWIRFVVHSCGRYLDFGRAEVVADGESGVGLE